MKNLFKKHNHSTIVFSLLLGLCFLILGIIRPAQASIWNLNNGNGTGRDNSNFLNQDFWESNPNDDDIIRALFGSGDEGSIYTSNRDSACSRMPINVEHINNINSLSASGNTIYVLSGDSEEISNTIGISQHCTAIVSSNPNGTVLNSTTTAVANMINIDHKGGQIIIDNIKINGNNLTEKGINIDAHNVSINNVDTANNTKDGIYANGISETKKNLLFNHVNSYNNNIGINIEDTEKIIINNLKAYNNSRYGLQAENSSYISINNSQIFKQAYRGIYVEEGTGIVLNNIQTYNNSLGVLINDSHDITLNNLLSYRNVKYGPRDKGLEITGSYNLYRYGNNILDYHGGITEEDRSEPEIDLERTPYSNPGCYDDNDSSMFCYDTDWDYFTNTIDQDGKFLYPWYNGVTNPYYFITYGYQYWNEAYQGSNTIGYSYGSGILTQTEPVKYDENNEIVYWTGGTHNANNYIGSHVQKTSGSLTGIYLLTGQTPTWGEVTTGPFVMSINDTDNGIIDYFNLFGHLENYTTGTNIDTGAEIYLSTGVGFKTMVPQIWGNQYFATHREETTYYSCGGGGHEDRHEDREECDLGANKGLWPPLNGPDKACNEVCELNPPTCSVSLEPNAIVAGEETEISLTISTNYDRVELTHISISGFMDQTISASGHTEYSTTQNLEINTGGTYDVILTVSNPLSGDVSATCSTTLNVLAPDIYIEKSVTPETDIVANWTEVIYTIDYGNNGDSTGYNVEIIEQLPTSFTGNWDDVGIFENNTLIINIGDLAPYQTGQIILTGTITNSGEFVNIALISGSNFENIESIVTGSAVNNICGNKHVEPSEDCDGEEGCNDECEWITPTCTIEEITSIYSGGMANITGSTQSWAVFSGIKFSDNDFFHSIWSTGNYSTGHSYEGGDHTIYMTVVNPNNTSLSGECSLRFSVDYCGDGEVQEDNGEECDGGSVYFPEPGMACAEAPDITIGDFTIQACNLGANVVGTGEDSYGRHFQRGNNFGFWNGIEGQTDESGNASIATSTEQVDTTGKGPGNWYSSNTFITANEEGNNAVAQNGDWSSNQNDNLRGGLASDGPATIPTGTDAEDRQGPCPDGYHVPSQGEWNQLLITWAGENGIDLDDYEGYKSFHGNAAGVQKFMDDLLIPFAGYRYYDFSATVSVQGEYGNYWSSSPIGSASRILNFNLSQGYVSNYSFTHAIGLSLRCFQNPHTAVESEKNACSNECTWNVPSCELTASPLTGFNPFQTTFTISGVNTGWMNFEYLDFGDGNSPSNLNTGNLNYNYEYIQTGNFTATLVVSNSSNPELTGSCQVEVQSIQNEYCGDGIKNGDEQCDGEDGCNDECEWITPTCTIEEITSIYSGGMANITGSTQSWAVFSGIKFSDNDFFHSIWSTGGYNGGYTYFSGGMHTVSMTVVNPLSGSVSSSCTGEIKVEYCGDGVKNGNEQCDGEDGCDDSCKLIIPTCEITLDSPIYSGQTANITGTTETRAVFNEIDFGLPNTLYSIWDTGNYNTGYTYFSGGMHTVSMTVVNPLSGDVFNTCNTEIQVNYCGDLEINGDEECDGGDGCDNNCQLITPSCNIETNSPIYSGELANITGTAQSWAVFSGINFGLPRDERHSIWSTGQYVTGHIYPGGAYGVFMTVTNPLSGEVSYECVYKLIVRYCGDSIRNGSEECDKGDQNGNECSPEYGGSCDYCSSSCELITEIGEHCGDLEINGDEECDGEDWCDDECKLITPTCLLALPNTVQSGDSFTITGYVGNGWTAWSGLSVSDSLYHNFGGITGMVSTGVPYTANNTGEFDVELTVYNPDNSSLSSICTGSFKVVQPGVYINKYISGDIENIGTGEYITYIIEYGNNGDGTGYNINISDTLPDSFTGVSSSTGELNDGVLTVNVGELGPEETGLILISGYFTEFGIGITNVATLNGDDISLEDEVEIDVVGCGDGITQEGEQCDWGNDNGTNSACSNKCKRNTPSCNINAISPTYSGQNINIIGTTEQDWAVFSGINFGLPNVTHSIRETGTYDTGYEYYSGGIYNISMTVVNPFSTNLYSACTKVIDVKYCGNETIDDISKATCKVGCKPEREECDLGEDNGPNSACSSECTWNIPSCELSANPLTGFNPFQTTFTISGINTGWMNFDALDFDDGSYTENLNTGIITYDHIYTQTGLFTPTLTVSNSLRPSIRNSCEVSVSSLIEEYCGDGITQEGEECDGGDGCNEYCRLIIPTCEVDTTTPTYSGRSTNIRGISEQSWAVFSGINFGLPDTRHNIWDTGSYTTGYEYYSGGDYTVSMTIVNPLSGDVSSVCTGSISVGYCGNEVIDSLRQTKAQNALKQSQSFPVYYGSNMPGGEKNLSETITKEEKESQENSSNPEGRYISIEDCDLGDENGENSACNEYCIFNSPACSIVPYQSTIAVGTEAGFTSVLNGSWVSLSGVNFGDGSSHSFDGTSGRNYMEYSHIYDQTGWYIQTFYVYNHLVDQLEMCNAVVQVVDESETTPPENNEYSPNIYINKSILPNNNINTNTLITYIIEYGNSGNGTGYNMNLRDIIPNNFTGNWSHIGSWDGNKLMLLSGILSPGRTGHIILTGYFTSGGHTTNHAVISTSNAGTKTGSVSANIQGSVCGNGFVEIGEYCDDGPLNGTSGHCSSDCSRFLRPEPINTGHGSAGVICRYSDENYYDNGPFTDTIKHWGFEYIEIMRKSCLHRGKSTMRGLWQYYPNDNITKAEVLKTLVKIMGIAKENFDIITEDMPYNGIQLFADVPGYHRFSWYTQYAYNFGLTNELYSISNQQKYLKPDTVISRYEIIKKVMEVYKKIVSNTKIDISTRSNLTDISKANPYYQYVREAEVLGIISGEQQKDGSYKFMGDRALTRAEFAKIVSIPFTDLLFID